ncbi:MAG: hypothetical protein JWM59_3278 [Verrucomicrobiales bacterium]|nr:hypothetical protein [Verrucomicrobiales bacterium]
MNAPLLNRLQGLTSMWCRLTGRSADDFNKEFFSRLGTLNRFTGQFPGEMPAGLIRAFEAAVMESLHGKFPETEVQRVWIQLPSGQADGAGVGL